MTRYHFAYRKPRPHDPFFPNWALTTEKLVGRPRVLVWGFKKPEALKLAIAYCKAHSPSSMLIHKKNGEFQEERTYPKSMDPKNRKG